MSSSYMQIIGGLESRVAVLERRVGELVESAGRAEAARGFLERALREGPRPVTEVLAEGAAAGHAVRSLYRSASELDIVRFRERVGSGRARQFWRLPPTFGGE